jgi:hypothetical protein
MNDPALAARQLPRAPKGFIISAAATYIAAMSSVRVKVVDGEIVVTDPATEWWVSYRHSTGMNGLIATQVVTDPKAKVSERAVFLGQAFGKATERARKLGWIA